MDHMGPVLPEITPENTYDIDSDEFDSEQEREPDQETYERLLEEAYDDGYTDEEVIDLVAKLKERGLVNFLRDFLKNGARDGEEPSLRKLLLSLGVLPPPHLLTISDNFAYLPYAKLALSRILRHRQKLPHLNTVADAIDLLRNAKKIIVLSGAGISTSCGIPDFRSANGLYAQLQADGKWELDEPQDMFDMRVFRERPEIFYSFAKQIYPSNFTPSPCHRWIKSLEDRDVLLRNYTQNIDTLESAAGVQRVLQCHGSFSTASCLRCKTRVPGKTIEPYILSQQVPHCGTCRQQRDLELAEWRARKEAKRKSKGKGKAKAEDWDQSDSSEESEWGGGEPGIIKPDITFFGQALDSQFDESLYNDREEVDLLIIIGTSLKVAPVSEVLTHIPHSVPQILINLTPVTHVRPDICLIGDADTIVTYLSHELGWDLPPPAAVVHSPGVGKPDVEHDTLVKPKLEPLPPEEVAWISGSDELQHIHLLSSKAELAFRAGSEPAQPSQAVASPPLNPSDTYKTLVAPAAVDRSDGVLGSGDSVQAKPECLGVDDDRPAKRSRVSTPVP